MKARRLKEKLIVQNNGIFRHSTCEARSVAQGLTSSRRVSRPKGNSRPPRPGADQLPQSDEIESVYVVY